LLLLSDNIARRRYTGEPVVIIHLNDTNLQVADAVSIGDVLREQGLGAQQGFAVAVNDVVVPRTDWNTRRLQDNDTILVIKAFGGG